MEKKGYKKPYIKTVQFESLALLLAQSVEGVAEEIDGDAGSNRRFSVWGED